MLALVIIPTVILSVQIQTIHKQQVDTLDKLMDIELILSGYSNEINSVDELVYEGKKDCLGLNRGLIEGVVAAEARGDTLDGMIAVAQTIKDRGDLWDIDYADVVLADGQYADVYTGEISDKVKLAVELVFDCGYRISEEPITHFHSFGEGNEPYWANAKICRGSLNSKVHQFYY